MRLPDGKGRCGKAISKNLRDCSTSCFARGSRSLTKTKEMLSRVIFNSSEMKFFPVEDGKIDSVFHGDTVVPSGMRIENADDACKIVEIQHKIVVFEIDMHFFARAFQGSEQGIDVGKRRLAVEGEAKPDRAERAPPGTSRESLLNNSMCRSFPLPVTVPA